ncbi:MAG: flagellar hook-length control protein FliK, partial [Sphingomonas sp.]
VDHIESLRDDADAHDTRIRLTPDILGTVDIAVRRHGDALHVHFSAERDATRALLAETRPRLTEMAEARGIRIASASINGGGVGSGDRQPQPQSDFARPAAIAAPARAAIDAADGVGARDLVKPLAGQRLA